MIVYTQFRLQWEYILACCAQMLMYNKTFCARSTEKSSLHISLFVWKFHVDFSPVCFCLHLIFNVFPSNFFERKLKCCFVSTTSNIQPVISSSVFSSSLSLSFATNMCERSQKLFNFKDFWSLYAFFSIFSSLRRRKTILDVTKRPFDAGIFFMLS